jgi:biopolymer transport protein TolR
MAFGRLERGSAAKPMSDINMTPLIDVMLVLLVIFMVTAPLMSASLKLELPRAAAAGTLDAPATLQLAITPDGALHLNEQPIEEAALRAELTRLGRSQLETEVQLRADRRVPYGRVAELIGWLQESGLSRIGLVTETPASAP